MRRIIQGGLAFIFVLSFLTACGNQQEVSVTGTARFPVVEEGKDGGQVTIPPVVEEVEKATIAGCETGAGDFNAPFLSGDFKTANDKASCVFNESVKINADKPDTEAAKVAFLSRFALSLESPEIEYLVFQKLSANSFFGPNGVPDFNPILNSLGANQADFIEGLLFYFKKHADAGHLPNEVLAKAYEFVNGHFGDWHALAKAMARDPLFDSRIPGAFLGQQGSDAAVNYTDAAAVDFYISAARAFAKVASHYDVGVSGPESLTSRDALMADMNAYPKLLGLLGSSDASDAVPYVDSMLNAIIQSAGNFRVKPSVLFPANIFPNGLDAALTATELKASLQGRFVWTSASDFQFGINLKQALAELPDSNDIPGPVLSEASRGIEPSRAFLEEFTKGFSEHRK
ncbi:MAG TPA: hypothetical protein DF383_06490 [Deltaproteobacteria bacterium]|nr:hypothetical protein [Deltaproteobacteria bacterium]